MRFSRPSFRSVYLAPAAAYAVVCLVMWPIPVFGLLHVESSAVIAGTGFFAAGISSLFLFRRGRALADVLPRQIGLLALPLVLLTVTLLWRPNCGYLQGAMLFGLFTVPSVALGVALAFCLDAVKVRRPVLWYAGSGLAIAIIPVLYDLGLHPQFYTYNHVWGGVLGPIYDEELAIRPGLFFFRGLTLWWAAALVLIGFRATLRRERADDERARQYGLGLLAVALIITGTYVAAPWLGINSPEWYIQRQLGGHVATDRFDIYYSPDALSEGELKVILDAHTYRYHQLTTELGVTVPGRIATYLYPGPDTRAALTGSRNTSVAPVWLARPQIHMLQDRFEGSFAHELAHVVSREFGMPIIRASPAIGLVEGLAVAVDIPNGLPPPHAQVAAALRHREALGVYRGGSLADAVASQLSPLGFWTGRGAVSYVTMGSFVRFLIDTYGVEPLREAYARGNLSTTFGKPVSELAAEWEAFVRQQPDDPEATALVMARFSQPSLFEVRCPHYVRPVVRHLRRGRDAEKRGDVEAARAAFDAALRADSTSDAAIAAWAGIRLADGETTEPLALLERAATRRDTLASALLLTRLGDARKLAGDEAGAADAYQRAVGRLQPFARQQRVLIAARQDLAAVALRELLAPQPALKRAEVLDEIEGAELFAGLLFAEAGEFARAAALIDSVTDSEGAAVRLSWQAAFYHAAGDRLRAAQMADAASVTFAEQGAISAAAREADRGEKLRWLIFETDPDS